MAQILSLVIGYFIGAIVQTSYWYGKRQNVDIRNYGSGNAGTTNAMRTLGRKAGIVTAVGDILKVFLSALICWAIFRQTGMSTILIFLYSGLGTVLGHNFPFFMKFKGGKGIATTAGVIISLFFQPNALWVMTLIGVITFFGVLILTRYVSLASLVLVTEFLIEFIIWSGSGNTELRGRELAQGICLVIIIVALCYLRHIGNIERLLDGNERRFGEKQKPVQGRHRIERKPEEEDYYSFGDEEEAADALMDEADREDVYQDEIIDDSVADFDPDSIPEVSEYDEDYVVEGIDEEVFNDSPTQTEHDASPVRKVETGELERTGESEAAPKRKFIWDAEKQCYVRYKDPDW